MGEYSTEMIDRMTKKEQERSDPTSQATRLATSYANIVRTASSTTNVNRTSTYAERVEKFDYTSSEKERERMLIQFRVTKSYYSRQFY